MVTKNSKQHYNVEYAHLYSADVSGDLAFLDENIERTRSIIDRLSHYGISYCLSVLIDDYSEAFGYVDPESIITVLSDRGLTPDYVVMESEMAHHADYFIKFLPKKYLIEDDNQVVFQSASNDSNFPSLRAPARRYKSIFMEKAHTEKGKWDREEHRRRITLRQQRCQSDSSIVLCHDTGSQVRYSCPLLTACWYMARLGVEPFTTPFAYRRKGCESFIGNRILTVLPIDFLKVESTAVELISLSRTKPISKRKKQIEYHFY